MMVCTAFVARHEQLDEQNNYRFIRMAVLVSTPNSLGRLFHFS